MKCPNCCQSLWFVKNVCPFCKKPIDRDAIPQPKRPLSVTIISWFLLVASGYSLILGFLLFGQKASHEFALTTGMQYHAPVAIIGGLIGLLAGVAMLHGDNWGRLLYLWAMPLVNIFKWLAFGFAPTSLLTVVGYLVFLYFLTRPGASAFFQTGAQRLPEAKPPGGNADATDAHSATGQVERIHAEETEREEGQ